MAPNLNLNGLLFTQSFLATAHGFWMVAALLTVIPLLFNLNVFSDTNEQPDDPGVYSIVELCLGGASFLVSFVGSFTVLAGAKRITTPLTQFALGAFYLILFVICVIILGLRLNKMGILSDFGFADDANTCRDSSFTGNPIARLELAGYKVETKTDCMFNVYDSNLVNINQFGGNSSEPILVDWSNVFNYDSANLGVLAQAAQSAGEDVDAAAMPLLHEYWYWGCDPVCHPRHKLNNTWLAYSFVNCGAYLILMIVSFAAGVEANRSDELATINKGDEEKGLLQTDKAEGDAGGDDDEDDGDAGGEVELKRRNWSSMRF